MVELNVSVSDLKAFLKYVYRLEDIVEYEGYDKRFTTKVERVFTAITELT